MISFVFSSWIINEFETWCSVFGKGQNQSSCRNYSIMEQVKWNSACPHRNFEEGGRNIPAQLSQSCILCSSDSIWIFCHRMAPEVIACDEQPDATYDNRVSWANFSPFSLHLVTWLLHRIIHWNKGQPWGKTRIMQPANFGWIWSSKDPKLPLGLFMHKSHF